MLLRINKKISGSSKLEARQTSLKYKNYSIDQSSKE